jgi:hypothetical protein
MAFDPSARPALSMKDSQWGRHLQESRHLDGPGRSKVVHWLDGPQDLVVILGRLPSGPTPMA